MLTSKDLQLIRGVVREEIKEQLTPIQKAILKLQKKTDLIIRFFDREVITLKKRVSKIEDNLGILRKN